MVLALPSSAGARHVTPACFSAATLRSEPANCAKSALRLHELLGQFELGHPDSSFFWRARVAESKPCFSVPHLLFSGGFVRLWRSEAKPDTEQRAGQHGRPPHPGVKRPAE